MGLINTTKLDQGGASWKRLKAGATTAWTPTGTELVRELVVLSESTFTTLTGDEELTIDATVKTSSLPVGSYRGRFAAVTITAGDVLLIIE